MADYSMSTQTDAPATAQRGEFVVVVAALSRYLSGRPTRLHVALLLRAFSAVA